MSPGSANATQIVVCEAASTTPDRSLSVKAMLLGGSGVSQMGIGRSCQTGFLVILLEFCFCPRLTDRGIPMLGK